MRRFDVGGVDAFKQIINELNVDLEAEYRTGIQYLQHASLLKDEMNIMDVNIISQHSNSEFNHAKVLNDIIVYLGGIPTITVTTRKTSSDKLQMLKEDLQGEYDALTRYLYRINHLERIGLYDLSLEIKIIIQEETQHIRGLKQVLGLTY